MVTCYMIRRDKNDDYYHKGREGGGQRVMIEIIISENDDNDGRVLTCTCTYYILSLLISHVTGQFQVLGSRGRETYYGHSHPDPYLILPKLKIYQNEWCYLQFYTYC